MLTKIVNQKSLQVAGVAGFYSLLFAIPLIASAWSTSQSAEAVCTRSGTADIDVKFTNTESDQSNAMNVVAKDDQTGNSINLGTVESKQTKTGEITTNRTSLGNGMVTFSLTWAHKSGSDSRTASYSGVNCQPPTPTPTPRPTSTPTPTPRPTNTPTPRPTNTPTPTPKPSATPTPTNAPTATPTPTTMPTATPTETPVPTQATIAVATNVNQTNGSNTATQNQNDNNNNTNNINITNNNTSSAVVEAQVEQATPTPTPEEVTVQPAPKPTELPKTGAETDVLFGLISLIPAGLKLRKWAKA